MLFSGFLMTRLTKLARLPNVTAYILAGILIGPYVLNLVPQRIIDGTDFLSDIALAFIAFSTGEFFKLDILKRNGMKVVWITILEAVLASVFIFILTYFVLRLDLAFSIVLAALASATAPASTMMTIRQTGAKGDFVDTLLQVVALDDVVGLVLYSVAISIALASLSGASGFSFETLGKPVVLNLLVVGLGSLFGLFMKLLMPQKRSKDNKLIISVALLFAFCGVCALLDLSPLLGCMMMGTVYTNIADDDKLFKQLNYFSPPILLLFFVRSGMSFQLDALVSSSGNLDGVPLLVIGVSYFLVRILGKYAGAWLGCRLVKKHPSVQIDLNSIAQGATADYVARWLDSLGWKDYLVEVGGEIFARGHNAKGGLWRVGIDKPIEGNVIPGAQLQVRIGISNRGLATSGNYRKFYTDSLGRKIVHTFDARTGAPVISNLLSATVVARTAAQADAYGTLCMVMGLNESIRFLESRPDLEAYLVWSDDRGNYRTYMTPGMESLVLQ